eukprot:TRINITY_DN7810_c0_g1_i1.p1 TRINITY_DN7810_c0_g1~~TRINITY_DN7810_c0_g1_i1.p1  ORF type:complete len:172 (-),score=21.55 TRINITY_DN7810_c0_g1_i1:381-854(-)
MNHRRLHLKVQALRTSSSGDAVPPDIVPEVNTWARSCQREEMESGQAPSMPSGMPSAEQAAEQQQKQEAAEEQRRVMLTSILTKEAFDRLQRVQLVKPDKATEVENTLLKKAQMGMVGEKVPEQVVIQMLQAGSGGSGKSGGNVIFKRRNLDNDDEW